jgi:hypothetical protein
VTGLDERAGIRARKVRMNVPRSVFTDALGLMRNCDCQCPMALVQGSYENLRDSCFQSNQRVKSANGSFALELRWIRSGLCVYAGIDTPHLGIS